MEMRYMQHLIAIAKPLCDCCWTEVLRSTHEEECTKMRCGQH